MNNRTKFNPLLRVVVFAAFVVFIAIITAIGLFYYIFAIPEPEGLSLASWPYRFTDNFSVWMENNNGSLKIEEIAIQRLDEYGLWLQVINEDGEEIYSHNKPQTYPAKYTVSQLVKLETSEYEDGNTVFVSSFEDSDKTWNYLIGFPYAVGKYMLYYNGENVGQLSPVFRTLICILSGLIIVFVFLYSLWLTRHLRKITKGISEISLRSYMPLSEKGMFSQIYKELNKLDIEIRCSDKVRKDTERTRREWIANITHDLKTPLSPVKGYAELLLDNSLSDMEIVHEYGKFILKNANHAEMLIDDLKLTYQLESGVIPFNPKKIQFIRYLRDIIIDIVNDPAFIDRDIELITKMEEMSVCVDVNLFRRAIVNLLVNSLTHNSVTTKVTVIVKLQNKNKLSVTVKDNGKGISDEEQSQLFERYYRGTNTNEKPEGSGLGLAIAKQIIILHGGDISVKSRLNEGTEFIISVPIE